jgi:hypothetical protein
VDSGCLVANLDSNPFWGNFRVAGHTGGIDKAEILGTLQMDDIMAEGVPLPDVT